MTNIIPQSQFASDFPEAFATLPEAYQADSCLEFFIDDNDVSGVSKDRLYCRPKADQEFALGKWVCRYQPIKNEWVNVP